VIWGQVVGLPAARVMWVHLLGSLTPFPASEATHTRATRHRGARVQGPRRSPSRPAPSPILHQVSTDEVTSFVEGRSQTDTCPSCDILEARAPSAVPDKATANPSAAAPPACARVTRRSRYNHAMVTRSLGAEQQARGRPPSARKAQPAGGGARVPPAGGGGVREQ